MVVAPEAAFRETATHMGKVLQGENLIEARKLLREIVGAVRLEPDTDHLIAKYECSEFRYLRPRLAIMVAGARYAMFRTSRSKRGSGEDVWTSCRKWSWLAKSSRGLSSLFILQNFKCVKRFPARSDTTGASAGYGH